MSLDEQADALIDRAIVVLESGTAAERSSLASTIRNFTDMNMVELANSGSQWRVDQLDAAWSQLSGNGPVQAAPQMSPFFSGANAFLHDSTSLDQTIGAAATEQAKRLGGGLANAANAGAGQLMKSPAILAVLVVGGVLAAAWAWRSFK